MNKISRQKGFSQIILLVIISFLAIALPITTKLVQKVQENRSSAYEPECDKGQTKCTNGKKYVCSSSYRWTQSGTCASPPVSSNPCTTVRYGSWSACVNGKQTRTVTAEPAGCSGGVTVGPSSQSCTIAKTCTSFSKGEWGACNKYADGKYYQTRTVTGSPSGCTGGNPPISKQECPCTGTNRPLGCSCGANTDCSSGTCSGKECVAKTDLPLSCLYGDKTCKDGYVWKCEVVTIVGIVDAPPVWTKTSEKCTTFYYYTSGICKGDVFPTLADCNSKHSTCYSSSSACMSANSCAMAGGTCRSECRSNETSNSDGRGQCSPSQCCTVSTCTPGATKCVSGTQEQKCGTDSKWGAAYNCPTGVCKDGACTSSSPGPGPGPGPSTIICTANAVSTTECYDSTHLKKCNSDGTAWIQGDQCSSGQTCNNGVCGGVGAKLSFRISFDGVAPGNLSCQDNFKTISLTVGTVGTTLTQQLSVGVSKTDLTTSKGYAIFGADNVTLGAGFSGVTNVYARIKGQVHARMYYCVKSQSTKNTSEVCNLSLDGSVNNFYEYPVLGGDVNQDGKVDTADFSVIKSDLNKEGCGYKTDLNGDGKVNGPDIKIHKTALESKYDE